MTVKRLGHSLVKFSDFVRQLVPKTSRQIANPKNRYFIFAQSFSQDYMLRELISVSTRFRINAQSKSAKEELPHSIRKV